MVKIYFELIVVQKKLKMYIFMFQSSFVINVYCKLSCQVQHYYNGQHELYSSNIKMI